MASGGGTDAFLSGEGIPVPVAEIESELTHLWGPAAEREGGPDLDQPNVTRVTLANLVVADFHTDGDRTRELIQTVTPRYPCRAIVLRPAPGQDGVTAEVAAVCHLPAPGRPQVCAEQIVLRAGDPARKLLPGAVRPLLETDLPLVLWWAGDPRPDEALFRDLADESARLILDLPDPQADPGAVRLALDLSLHRYGRDLSWFGITPWRELVAQFFDPPGHEAALATIEEVEIEVVAPSNGRLPRVAAWTAGWLAGALDWTCERPPRANGPRSDAIFRSPAGPIRVLFRVTVDPATPLPHLSAVRLRAGYAGTFSVERAGEAAEVRVTADARGHDPLPRVVRLAEWDAARRLAAALESARDDPPYRRAVPHVLRLLGEG
jgi:hypothetical protein